MLSMNSLRVLIKEIFNLDDEHVIPITSNWFAPDIKFEKVSGTYVGYRIVNKRFVPFDNPQNLLRENALMLSLRLSFMGDNAENLSTQVTMWEQMEDIQSYFASKSMSIVYDDMECFSYPLKIVHFKLAWIVDISVYSACDLRSITSLNSF